MNIELPLDGTDRETLQAASKSLYGNMHVMEAILVIGQARDARFYQGGVAEAIGCKSNQANTVLGRLKALGVIEPEERGDPGQSRDYYRRLPSVLWEATAQHADEILRRPDSGAVANLADRR